MPLAKNQIPEALILEIVDEKRRNWEASVDARFRRLSRLTIILGALVCLQLLGLILLWCR